jgi:glutamate-1-semialdehyde 2,1-aminomutase
VLRSNPLTTTEAAYRTRTPRSAALHEEARCLLPGGVTRSVTLFQPYPVYIASGRGCRVVDVDFNEYLDIQNNFGSMIHGHGNPAIVAALSAQATRGTDFGAPTELHLRLAREIASRLPSMQRMRFTTSGTEAVMYAIRAARAFTGRSKILKFEGSYHGGYDSVSLSIDPGPDAPAWPTGVAGSFGLPPDVASYTLVAPFNDVQATEEILRANRDDIAAVIVEPVTVRGMIPAEASFLAALRELTRELRIVLIFDEVVTFRLGVGGAQGLAGITPDLTTLGKLIGGGLPVGAFGGREDIMVAFDPSHRAPVHHSGTFAGNAATMAAGLAALDLLTPVALSQINRLGVSLRGALIDACRSAGTAAQVTGAGSLAAVHLTDQRVTDYRSSLRADRATAARLHLALLNRGVFARSGGSFFLSTPMTEEDVSDVAHAFREALIECAS